MVDVIKGKYQLVREIARSNDIVYEAVDTTLGRRIAVKELNLAPSLTGQARRDRIERFNREARAAGRLSHPNIVSVTDFGEENGRYFIAMEFLEGQSLREAMQVRGAYPLREAMDIACQVLDALAFAHANRVVHRDIKPDNIHILPGGLVKLTDFGIARLSEEPALTGDGQVFGTPSYMSPEQIEGKAVDHRTDLFSLAVVLYEMLAGRKPFMGDSVVAITYAIMNSEPPQLHGAPAGVEQVIRRALSKQPGQRQISAEQVKMDLRNAEQVPALFFPQQPGQTNMGRTGYGYHGSASPAVPPLPPMPGFGGGAPVALPGNGGQALPWTWNTPGAGAQPVGAPVAYSVSQAPSMAGPGGMNPYSSPPYPAGPREPLILISPAMRSFLIAVAVAAVLGGVLALACIWFMKSYSDYQTSAAAQQVRTAMSAGEAAYKDGDYSGAASDFDRALQDGPAAADRATLARDLGYTYVQIAREARAHGDLPAAQTAYQKALVQMPDYAVAHAELAAILDQQGNPGAASEQRSAAGPPGAATDAPPSVLPVGPPAASNTGAAADPNQFIEQKRAEARLLIQQGDALNSQGDVQGARDHWEDAVGKAPGYSEASEAQAKLDGSSNSAGSSGSQ